MWTLDANARIIVQFVCYKMLHRQKDQLAATKNEDAAEAYANADASAEAEAAYAAETTPP